MRGKVLTMTPLLEQLNYWARIACRTNQVTVKFKIRKVAPSVCTNLIGFSGIKKSVKLQEMTISRQLPVSRFIAWPVLESRSHSYSSRNPSPRSFSQVKSGRDFSSFQCGTFSRWPFCSRLWPWCKSSTVGAWPLSECKLIIIPSSHLRK